MATATTLAFTGQSTINFTYPIELVGLEIERAIVDHGVPEREGDLHQDMGAHSRHYEIEGLCTLTELGSLTTLAELSQIATNGKATLTHTNEPGTTVWSVSQLAIRSLKVRYPSGHPLLFRFNMKFVRTNQT